MRPKPPHAALALAALLALPLAAGETTEKPAGKPAGSPAAAAMKIHVDPVTGQVTSKPDPAAKAAVSAPAGELPPLKVEKVSTKAGGKKVRLDDRFMMEVTATVGPDGKSSQTCVAAQDKPAEAKEHRHDR